jgi:hypothetical protein
LIVGDVVGVLVVVVERLIVGDVVGALVVAVEGLMDGALVKVLICSLETTAGSPLGALDNLPVVIVAVRKLSKLIEPNPVDGSHPTAGKKPSLQHLLNKLPSFLFFSWLQLFLVPPVISLVNCA